MDRREFLKDSLSAASALYLIGLWGCGTEIHTPETQYAPARAGDTVLLYDTYAMALYMDGTLGPKTGIIKVEYVLKNEPVDLEFWHGHGGRSHRFTLTPEHFSGMKSLKKIHAQTTVVEGHSHKLFIDTGDPRWRVPGAQPVPVPLRELL